MPYDGPVDVSIHAPARRATCPYPSYRDGITSFNPRPRAAGDVPIPFISGRHHKFQSTPPRGGRLLLTLRAVLNGQFQSTPPRGGRQVLLAVGALFRKFQSTPPRGGRPSVIDNLCVVSPFQSTPPRGGRQPRQNAIFTEEVSIHAPARGATVQRVLRAPIFRFQSTPPRGGRLRDAPIPKPQRCFNPRPRAGGDKNQRISSLIPVVSIHARARGAT